MEKVKVSKTVLIIEEIFYIFMIIYGAMFLIAFTLSAFKMNMWFGILIGALCGLGAGIFVYFVLFRLKLICTKKVIYESDLVFWRRFIPSKYNEEEKEEVKSIVSDKVKENNLYLSEADIEKRIIIYVNRKMVAGIFEKIMVSKKIRKVGWCELVKNGENKFSGRS